MFEKRPQTRVAREEISTYPRVKKSVENLQRDSSWFQGTRSDIIVRQERVAQVVRQTRALLADSRNQKLSVDQEATAANWLNQLSAESNSLRESAELFLESEFNEEIQELPQYSAKVAGAKVFDQKREIVLARRSGQKLSRDWKRFVAVQPSFFVQSNASAVASHSEMRRRAVDYIAKETSAMENPKERAVVIDDFTNNVEVERRSARRSAAKSATRTASNSDSGNIPDILLLG